TDVLLRLFCRPAVHRDEHLDLSRPGYPARVDGFVDGLDRAIPRDELRHRAGHLADAGLAARARQRGLRRGISLDRAAAGPGHGRGEPGVRTTPARSPGVIGRLVGADNPASGPSCRLLLYFSNFARRSTRSFRPEEWPCAGWLPWPPCCVASRCRRPKPVTTSTFT